MPVDVSTVRPNMDKAMKEPSMMTWMNASNVCFKAFFVRVWFYIVGFDGFFSVAWYRSAVSVG
jgi:hypothetical protein